MRIYIAGPMKGIPQRNYPAFYAAAAAWEAAGHIVLNPASVDEGGNMTWEDCMRASMRLLSTADAVAVLRGWKRSTGAKIEVYAARSFKWHVYDANKPNDLTEILDPIPYLRLWATAYLLLLVDRTMRAGRRVLGR